MSLNIVSHDIKDILRKRDNKRLEKKSKKKHTYRIVFEKDEKITNPSSTVYTRVETDAMKASVLEVKDMMCQEPEHIASIEPLYYDQSDENIYSEMYDYFKVEDQSFFNPIDTFLVNAIDAIDLNPS